LPRSGYNREKLVPRIRFRSVVKMPGFMETCEKAVRLSGRLLLDKLGTVSVQQKGPSDLVTEADFAAQELVEQTVLGAFPDHILIGEEDPAALSKAGRPAAGQKPLYRWIVDPLDGTTNYVHQVPHFSVSLALEHDGQILVGAVYNPAAEECFTAIAGEGAWLNGHRIHTSQVTDLAQALCAIGFPAATRRDSPELLLFLEGVDRIQGFRRTGSASLNLCYVACGRYDVAWSFSTKIWDIAAGTLLIREAGGIVTSPDGGGLILEKGRFLAAANEHLHRQIRHLVVAAGLAEPSLPPGEGRSEH
jgi:myo-inositol-1(or 4)-monophosphatase